MCLAIPGKVLSLYDRQGIRMAKVQFGGVTRESCVEYVPSVEVGEYVLVHVGFALSTLNEEEAERTYALLEELGQLGELDEPQEPDVPTG